MIGSSATLAQARTLHSQGRLGEAVSIYREVLAREPLNGNALHLMGLAMAALGDARHRGSSGRRHSCSLPTRQYSDWLNASTGSSTASMPQRFAGISPTDIFLSVRSLSSGC